MRIFQRNLVRPAIKQPIVSVFASQGLSQEENLKHVDIINLQMRTSKEKSKVPDKEPDQATTHNPAHSAPPSIGSS